MKGGSVTITVGRKRVTRYVPHLGLKLPTDPHDPFPSGGGGEGELANQERSDAKAVQELTELREALEGDEAKAAVVDFFDAWRFCPLSDAPSTGAVKANLEDAASQLLASLRTALAKGESR